MRKVFSIMLAIALLLAGCTKPESNNSIKADNITVFYGFSSYAMSSANQAVIDGLLNQFNSLCFEKTSEKIDLGSTFYVTFSCNGNSVKSFWVDKNCIFKFSGETQSYRISSGSFDYEYLKAVYKYCGKVEN